MTKKTHQTAEVPIYSIPFSIVGNALLLTLSMILIFFNETNQAILSFAYVTLVFSFVGIVVLFKSLGKTTFKTTPNEEA
jgi:Na+/melibiose symporter-like transporter